MDDALRLPVVRVCGSGLLLDHCARIDLLVAGEGGGAVARLETAVGPELARILLRALTGDHGLRQHQRDGC